MNLGDDAIDSRTKDSFCPACGYTRITSEAHPCWLCHEQLPKLDHPLVRRSVTREPPEGRRHPVLIGIALLITLLMLAMAVEQPGVLLVLIVAAIPALVRAVVVSRRAAATGQPLGVAAKVGAFLGMLGAALLVGIAAGVAFLVYFLATCKLGPIK